jgi:hypothetical protein
VRHMKKEKLANLLAFKANLFEIMIIAVFVALGVNILASGLIGYLDLSFLQSAGIGLLLVVLGALVLLRNAHPIKNGKYRFKGLICLEKSTNHLLAIEDYAFTEEVSKYIKALCTENKAFLKIWSDNPIGSGLSQKDNETIRRKPKSNDILIEAIEYYIIRILALHLSSHFNNNNLFSEDYLIKLERKNIPEILLNNRFIDMFSRPMEEREQFLNHGSNPSRGKVVYALGNDGAIFEHFEMVLPKGSSIAREKDSSISIITNRFKLNFRPEFGGWNTSLPRQFEKLYMDKDFRSISTFDVGLYVGVDFSAISLLTAKGWEYYWWLDSFLGKLEQSFSVNYFLSKISWHQNAAMMLMADNRRQKQLNEACNEQPKD